MAPSDFANADIATVVQQLTTEEAISLIAGVGFWHTHAVPRLGIPAVKVSDGPNGIRGNHFFMSTPAKCLPSSTAIGATWDTDLIHIVGARLLAGEAKLRAASTILAPTVNIQRNPLGGRSFESFSEDPYLSGMIAAAYVNGVQAEGIGTTIKHFVTNDKENDRMAYDSIVSPRALREIYLMPFMLAQKYAKPWSYMTAYNRVNGTHLSENKILKEVLRDEWKFDGMIMSDWFGVYSVAESINAGLDLEMPGNDKWRTIDKTGRSINSRKIMTRTVKERATKVLEFVQRCAKGAPEVLDGDGIERTYESEEDKLLMRQVASQTIVLLKNEKNILPLKPSGLKKVAILGGNAKALVLSGGGSAALKSSYFISPYEGIVNALGSNIEVTYSEGARAYVTLPSMDYEIFTEDGKRGWTGTWFSNGSDNITPTGPSVKTQYVDETNVFVSTGAPAGITPAWTLKLEGKTRKFEQDTLFEFGLVVSGRAKLFVDGNLVIDNWTRQRRGDAFFGTGTVEERGTYTLKANTQHNILVVLCNVRGPRDDDEDQPLLEYNGGVRLSGAPVQDADEAMKEAVQLAKEADVAILVVGLNNDWETEGYDRTTLQLAGRTDELVQKVAAVNPNTVVVTQSGSAITMPWVDSVPAIVHSWYLGNATGDAIADVLFGKANPSGKLSLTFPKRLEDVPSYGHFHSENGKVLYSEDLFVGYKHYHNIKIEPLFPFGFGLSYTTFSYESLVVGEPGIVNTNSGKDLSIPVSLSVTNTGSVAGSEVVQVYISFPATAELTHPPFALKAFAKVKDIKPGETREVKFSLDKYAVSYWEARIGSWSVDAGEYTVSVGPSSDKFPLSEKIKIGATTSFEWNGL